MVILTKTVDINNNYHKFQKPSFYNRVFDKKEFMAQNYEKELFAFKSRLQLNFQDESILLSALTHGSFEADQSEDQLTRCGEPNSKLALLGAVINIYFIH